MPSTPHPARLQVRQNSRRSCAARGYWLVFCCALACEKPNSSPDEPLFDASLDCESVPESCDAAFAVCIRRAERALRDCHTECTNSCESTCRAEGITRVESCRSAHARCFTSK